MQFDPWVQKTPWRKAWQPTPVFFPGESPWTKELSWLWSMGSQRVGHDSATNTHTQGEWEQKYKGKDFSRTDTYERSVEGSRNGWAEPQTAVQHWRSLSRVHEPPLSEGVLHWKERPGSRGPLCSATGRELWHVALACTPGQVPWVEQPEALSLPHCSQHMLSRGAAIVTSHHKGVNITLKACPVYLIWK